MVRKLPFDDLTVDRKVKCYSVTDKDEHGNSAVRISHRLYMLFDMLFISSIQKNHCPCAITPHKFYNVVFKSDENLIK